MGYLKGADILAIHDKIKGFMKKTYFMAKQH